MFLENDNLRGTTSTLVEGERKRSRLRGVGKSHDSRFAFDNPLLDVDFGRDDADPDGDRVAHRFALNAASAK